VSPELVACLSGRCSRERGRQPIRGAFKKHQPQETVSPLTMQSFRACDAGRELRSLSVIGKPSSKKDK